MMLPTVATLLALTGFAAAQVTTTIHTIENCFTSYDRAAGNLTSVPTSTDWRTSRGQGFARGVITPLVTATPAVSTATSTSVTTSTVLFTAPSVSLTSGIATVTTTVTSSSVISSISIFTSTVSVNSTITTTGTTTIPTLAGFTPVAVALAAQGEAPSRMKRWGPLNARNVFDRMLLASGVAAPTAGGRTNSSNRCMFKHPDPNEDSSGISLYPPLFPAAVNCSDMVMIDAVRVYPRMGTITSTVMAQASITTTTTTSTATTTLTIGTPSIGATSTFTSSITTVISSTTTSVSTTFATLTNTFTVNAPVATEYAACAANNTLGRVNGHPIAAGAQDLLALTSATNPTDCCELCQMTVNCTTSAFYDGTGDCLLGNGTGAATNQFFTTDAETDTIFVISNGKGEPNGDWLFGDMLG